MSHFKQALVVCMLIGALGWLVPANAAAEAPKPEMGQQAKDLVLKGDAKYTSCHDEEDAPEKKVVRCLTPGN